MRKHVASNNIFEILRWSTVQSTIFTVKSAYLDMEYDLLMEDNTNRWMKAIEEPGIGFPYRLEKNPKTSGNMVNQAHHLMRFEQMTGLSIKDVGRIVEFGGGYGSMVTICRRLGFVGDDHIYDLPEFSLVQDYYLHQVGMENRVFLHQVDDTGRFPAPPTDVDFLIGCHSLSEVRSGLRETFINATNADYVLISMFLMWYEDNTPKAINQMTHRLKKWEWEQAISGIQPNHTYLVGSRKP